MSVLMYTRIQDQFYTYAVLTVTGNFCVVVMIMMKTPV